MFALPDGNFIDRMTDDNATIFRKAAQNNTDNIEDDVIDVQNRIKSGVKASCEAWKALATLSVAGVEQRVTDCAKRTRALLYSLLAHVKANAATSTPTVEELTQMTTRWFSDLDGVDQLRREARTIFESILSFRGSHDVEMVDRGNRFARLLFVRICVVL